MYYFPFPLPSGPVQVSEVQGLADGGGDPGPKAQPAGHGGAQLPHLRVGGTG